MYVRECVSLRAIQGLHFLYHFLELVLREGVRAWVGRCIDVVAVGVQVTAVAVEVEAVGCMCLWALQSRFFFDRLRELRVVWREGV